MFVTPSSEDLIAYGTKHLLDSPTAVQVSFSLLYFALLSSLGLRTNCYYVAEECTLTQHVGCMYEDNKDNYY